MMFSKVKDYVPESRESHFHVHIEVVSHILGVRPLLYSSPTSQSPMKNSIAHLRPPPWNICSKHHSHRLCFDCIHTDLQNDPKATETSAPFGSKTTICRSFPRWSQFKFAFKNSIAEFTEANFGALISAKAVLEEKGACRQSLRNSIKRVTVLYCTPHFIHRFIN